MKKIFPLFILSLLVIWQGIALASIRSFSEYDIHFVTRNGISDAEWPGFNSFKEKTYVSLVVDQRVRKIYMGLQLDEGTPVELKNGEALPEHWKFPRRRGHAMIREKAGLEAGRFVLGGGVVLDRKGYILHTRTRGINGTSIERPPVIEFQVPDAATSNRIQGRTLGDTNGYLNYAETEKLARILADALGADIKLHYMEWGKIATEEQRRRLDQYKTESSERVRREGLPPAERWFHIFAPTGNRCMMRSLQNAFGS